MAEEKKEDMTWIWKKKAVYCRPHGLKATSWMSLPPHEGTLAVAMCSKCIDTWTAGFMERHPEIPKNTA